MGLSPPPGFDVLRTRSDGFLVVRAGDEGLAAWAQALDPERLLEERGERDAGGRGRVARVVSAEAQDRGPEDATQSRDVTSPTRTNHAEAAARAGAPRALVLKKYRHGGALAKLLPDLFLGYGRMLADLRASERGRAGRVPCALVLGLVLHRVGGLLWRGYLLTEEIEGAETLDRALVASGRTGGALASSRLAERAIETVREMHDAGIVHRDLNLGNLLARGDRVYVIDLDGARTFSRMTPSLRFSNLSRLDRSYVKLLGAGGPLSHKDRMSLLAQYCGDDEGMRLDFESRLAGHKRRLAWHRRFWRLRRRS